MFLQKAEYIDIVKKKGNFRRDYEMIADREHRVIQFSKEI